MCTELLAVVRKAFSQWEDMTYMQLSAKISGQRVKEDTERASEHLTRTRLQTSRSLPVSVPNDLQGKVIQVDVEATTSITPQNNL